MLNDLDRDAKIQLLRFVCSFAWADLKIADTERQFVTELVLRLDLAEEDREMVLGWLSSPPSEDDLDPNDIPAEHRKLFLDAAMEMITADGDVDALEVENLALFELLIS